MNRARWFSRLSIRARLVVAMLSLALFVIFTGSVFTVQFDKLRLRDQLAAEVHSYGSALSQDFAKVILVDGADYAADLVSKLKAFSDINVLVLKDDTGRVMLEYRRAEHSQDEFVQDVDELELSEPVEYQGVVLGQADFTIAETRIMARNKTMAELLLYFVPAMLLISVLLSIYLQRLFSAPLLRLTDAIRQVSLTNDFSLRLPVTERGEYGELFQGFNEMMARVEAASGALSDQTERLQVTLESIGDGVMTTNLAGEVQYLNPAAQQICKTTNKEALGHSITSVCRLQYPGVRVYHHPILECLKLGQVVTVVHDCNYIRDDGESLPVQATAAPILGRGGEVIGAIMVLVDVSQARALADELGYRASHDPLTDLLNRFGFEQQLNAVIDGAVQREEHHALLFMDLDQFKVVNDTSGHQVGDELLRDLSRLFKTKVRAGDSLARMGGDEFAIILRHCGLDNAQSIAEEIRSMMADYRFSWNDQTFDVGVSIGVTAIHADAGDASAIMSNADSACYAAKESGRNRVYVYRPNDQALAQRRGDMALMSRIRSAIDEQRLVLFAQPIYTISGIISGCELLIRMRDEKNELLSPAAFLPAAERYGLIEQLDRWVTEQAARWLYQEARALSGLNYCSMNLSAVSLGAPGFAEFIKKELANHPGAGERLCIEITETAAIQHLGTARDFIDQLTALGVRFALDDFGTGMSSFAYLKQLPVDMVKIDGSFVRDMVTDPVDRGMVRAINEMAQLNDKKTIAEFVESAEILHQLAELGVDYAQGYHLGKPMPLDDFLALLTDAKAS